MDWEEFSKELLEEGKRKGFSECETYFQRKKNFEVLILEGEISHYENSITQGVCFRGIREGKTGYAYCEKISDDAVAFVVEQAKDNAEIGEENTAEALFEGAKEYPSLLGVEENLRNLSEEEKISAAKQMEQAALSLGEYSVAIDYCVLEYHEVLTKIFNTKGLAASYEKNNAIAYVSAIAQQGKEIKTGSEYWMGSNWEEFNPAQIGRKAAENAISHLGATGLPSGEYPVILQNSVMAGLLSAFCSGFFGESVEKGFSMLKGKLHEKIASEKVSIRDDGLLPYHLGSSPFDSEGVPCQNKAVVSKGRLETFLYNQKAAKMAGVTSTGNGFKSSLQAPVQTACTNFYVVAGEKSLEELMEEMGNGILITEIAGLHSGTNDISGDFSLSAEGFVIKDGKKENPVEQITIAGNFYALLQEIEECGNDLRFMMPKAKGCMGAPSVFVRKVAISG